MIGEVAKHFLLRVVFNCEAVLLEQVVVREVAVLNAQLLVRLDLTECLHGHIALIGELVMVGHEDDIGVKGVVHHVEEGHHHHDEVGVFKVVLCRVVQHQGSRLHDSPRPHELFDRNWSFVRVFSPKVWVTIWTCWVID